MDGYTTYSADFNPRLREGGDVLWILLWILWITISIHASAKEATLVSQTSQQFALISIHASAKEATRGGWLHNLQCRFQSTPPRRRRRTVDIVVDIVDNHFNPRLREGGDFSSLSSVDGETISIHASAKEAT